MGGGLARFFPSFFRSRSTLVAENLFLRKEQAFYQERKIAPRRLTDAARFSLVVWSRLFNWREALVIVKPETLMGWHHKGFRLFWKWKSKGGRPRLPNSSSPRWQPNINIAESKLQSLAEADTGAKEEQQ